MLPEVLHRYVSCGRAHLLMQLAADLDLYDEGDSGNFWEVRDQIRFTDMTLGLVEKDLSKITEALFKLNAWDQPRAIEALLKQNIPLDPQWIEDYLSQYKAKSVADRKDFFYEEELKLFKSFDRIDDYFEFTEERDAKIHVSALKSLAIEYKNHPAVRDEYLKEAWTEALKEDPEMTQGNCGLTCLQAELSRVFIATIKAGNQELAKEFLESLQHRFPGVHTQHLKSLLADDEDRIDLLKFLLSEEGMKAVPNDKKSWMGKSCTLFDFFHYIRALPLLVKFASPRTVLKLMQHMLTLSLGHQKPEAIVSSCFEWTTPETMQRVALLINQDDSAEMDLLIQIIYRFLNHKQTIPLALEIVCSIKNSFLRFLYLRAVMNEALRMDDSDIWKQAAVLRLEDLDARSERNAAVLFHYLECLYLLGRPHEELYKEILDLDCLNHDIKGNYSNRFTIAHSAALLGDMSTFNKHFDQLIEALEIALDDTSNAHGQSALNKVCDILLLLPCLFGVRESRCNEGKFFQIFNNLTKPPSFTI